MQTIRLLIPFLLLSGTFHAGFPRAAHCQTASPQIANNVDRSISRARRLVRAHIENLQIPGMSVAVAVDGRLVWSEGFGHSDLETGVPVTPLTRFRIGSVSKTLTAAALAVLVEQGRVDLDAPIQKYVPAFPTKSHRVTVRHLAGHLSGIRHYEGAAEILRTDSVTSVLEALATFQDDPLQFEPGTKYGYSSYGYVLLSAVIEAASGQDFLSFMRDNIFGPLEMRSTGPDRAEAIIPHRIRFYGELRQGQRVHAPFVDNSSKWAAGGFLSTAEDLVRFGVALVEGKLLKPNTRNLLFTSMKTAAGEETGYGMGWRIFQLSSGRRAYNHGGQIPGGRAQLTVYPDERVVIAVLANTDRNIAFNEEESFLLADQFVSPTSPPEGSVDPSGTYSFETQVQGQSTKGLLHIYTKDGDLQGYFSLGPTLRPVPVITVRGKDVHLIALLGNWMEAWLSFAEEPFRGRWRYSDTVKGEFKTVTRVR